MQLRKWCHAKKYVALVLLLMVWVWTVMPTLHDKQVLPQGEPNAFGSSLEWKAPSIPTSASSDGLDGFFRLSFQKQRIPIQQIKQPLSAQNMALLPIGGYLMNWFALSFGFAQAQTQGGFRMLIMPLGGHAPPLWDGDILMQMNAM